RDDGAQPEYFDRLVEMLGIAQRLHHRPAELSGGEQQRVALARALINKPAIVLADEPTGNLDTRNSAAVLSLLRQTNKELGQTVLMITHNPEAAAYADRQLHMRDGELVGAAPAELEVVESVGLSVGRSRASSEESMTQNLLKPILPGKGASDYERYLRTDDLLSLQKRPEELAHPDELTFQVVHQSSELLMKAAAFELERARELIAAGDFDNAARLMRRANRELDYPIDLLHILETITPYDYHVIRAGLGHGSGLDSPGFTSLLHIGPRLGEVFFAQLEKAGLSVDDLYRRHTEFFGLHEVAEQLLDFDERMQTFRF